ncbi:MAG: glycerophosphodiester phosphodiesterase [Halothece sp.]
MPYHLIAHRGYSAVAPENTLASFRAAIREGVWGVEFDLHLSWDGIPVVIHDPTVDRTTNGTGNVAEKTISQLQALDAGSWFHPQFASETIPTFQEVLHLFATTSIQLLIEVKSPSQWSSQAIHHFLQILEPERDRCFVLSFDHDFLHDLQQLAPHITCGYGITKITDYSLEYIKTLDQSSPLILPHFYLVLQQPKVTQSLLEEGYEIITWTVDQESIAHQLFNQNIVKIITNNLLKT